MQVLVPALFRVNSGSATNYTDDVGSLWLADFGNIGARSLACRWPRNRVRLWPEQLLQLSRHVMAATARNNTQPVQAPAWWCRRAAACRGDDDHRRGGRH